MTPHGPPEHSLGAEGSAGYEKAARRRLIPDGYGDPDRTRTDGLRPVDRRASFCTHRCTHGVVVPGGTRGCLRAFLNLAGVSRMGLERIRSPLL